MFLIFGTSSKNKKLASSIEPIQCNHCGAVTNWNLYINRPYFTIFFFMKLFPIGKKSYVFCCPKCKYGVSINSNNLNQVLADVNKTDLLNFELNSDSFKKYLAETDSKLGIQSVQPQVAEPVQEPVQPQITEPVQEPVQPQITQSVQEPVQPQITQSVQEPVQPQITEPVQEPVQPAIPVVPTVEPTQSSVDSTSNQ